jgi:NitT/TauT family transport system substrate-binding protein
MRLPQGTSGPPPSGSFKLPKDRTRPGRGLGFTGTLFIFILFATAAFAQEPLTLLLNSSPNGTHSGLVLGQRKGYYQRAGIELSIEAGRGSGPNVRALGGRERAFAIAELASLIEGRSEGAEVIGVLLLVERSGGTLLTLADSGIRGPSDLKGRVVAGPAASFPRLLFPLLAEKVGLDLEGLRWIEVSTGAGISTLLEGRAHAVVSTETVRWRYERAAARQKKAIVSLPFARFGVHTYGLNLVAPPSLVQKSPEWVRRMVDATARAMAEALTNPREALELFQRAFPNYPAEGAASEWRATLEGWSEETLKAGGFGKYEGRRVEELRALLLRARQLRKEPPLEDLFTNQFVPSLSPSRGPFP